MALIFSFIDNFVNIMRCCYYHQRNGRIVTSKDFPDFLFSSILLLCYLVVILISNAPIIVSFRFVVVNRKLVPQQRQNHSPPSVIPYRFIKVKRLFTALSASINGSTDRVSTALERNSNYDAVTTGVTLRTNAFQEIVKSSAAVLLRQEYNNSQSMQSDDNSKLSIVGKVQDDVQLSLQQTMSNVRTNNLQNDDGSNWMSWIKSIPTPTVIDWTHEFCEALRKELNNNDNVQIFQNENSKNDRNEFVSRFLFRMVVLPSGSELIGRFYEPTGSIITSKLLFGGVICQNYDKVFTTIQKRTSSDHVPAWTMTSIQDDSNYGRMYEALDVGPAAILEVILLPAKSDSRFISTGRNMLLRGLDWKPDKIFGFVQQVPTNQIDDDATAMSAGAQWGKGRNDAFRNSFRSSVGGLQTQIDAIVRRVLDGRVIRPSDDDDDKYQMRNNDKPITSPIPSATFEAKELELLGLTPVRGLLLYGPPGCGKTALAREISKVLRARVPKIVSAPELLDRWVGGSEKLVRALFLDAEAELAACNGDATKSALHVVVIDEIDAVFRKRTSSEDSGEATRSSVVNQILAKLDGINAIPNVLIIGMTNRRELLDDALLRPGRLEVQIEVPLPDKSGRREILNIHFDALRRKGRLSPSLCCAIDGIPPPHRSDADHAVQSDDDGVEYRYDDSKPDGRRKRIVKKLRENIALFITPPFFDLASGAVTGGYSGADIAGLVRCAGSIALSRSRKSGTGIAGLTITLRDVKQALAEVKRI